MPDFDTLWRLGNKVIAFGILPEYGRVRSKHD